MGEQSGEGSASVTGTRAYQPNDGEAQEAVLAVMEALNAWDPYALVAQGAPPDEYESEARDIHQALTSGEIGSEQKLATRIAAVFEKWFEESFDAEECGDAARQIWLWWQGRKGKTGCE